jgi:ABC-type antimicrobial peptide transport system permease subunit
LTGALLGIPAGLLLATLRLWADLHIVLWQSFPWSSIAGLAIGSLILGAVLAALAAVYPALKAARLAPMEAMRVE